MRNETTRKLIVKKVIVTTTLIAALMAPAVAGAQTKLTFVPSVSVSAIADDNIFTSATRSADQTTVLGPGVDGSIDGPRASLRGSYSFDMLRSAYFSALNNIEARRHGMFESHFRQSPKTSFAFGGHYDRSENGGDLNFDTGFLMPRRRAQRWELAPAFAYRSTPKVTVRGQYNWVREALEQTMVANEHVSRLNVTRELSPVTAVSGGYLGRHFINGEDTQTAHAVLFGWTRRLAPFTMLTLVSGPRFSTRGTLAAEVVASLGRRSPEHDIVGYAVDYWRGESIILGVIGPVEVESGTGKFTIPIRRHVEVGSAAGIFRTSSLTQGRARVYHGEVFGSWSPRDFYSIGVSYGADFQRGDIRTSLLADRDLQRRLFVVKLTVAPRLSRAVKPNDPMDPLGSPSSGPFSGPSKRDQQ